MFKDFWEALEFAAMVMPNKPLKVERQLGTGAYKGMRRLIIMIQPEDNGPFETLYVEARWE